MVKKLSNESKQTKINVSTPKQQKKDCYLRLSRSQKTFITQLNNLNNYYIYREEMEDLINGRIDYATMHPFTLQNEKGTSEKN